MRTDRYGLDLATASAAARDAYVEGVDLMIAACPGAGAAFDRALAADPGFALAHLAKARALHLAGDAPGMQASFARAEALAERGTQRLRSQLEVFRRLFAGQPVAALAAVRTHMNEWPRDALVLSLAANQSGLIGISGLAGREQALADFLGGLAPHYGEDWFFDGHYGMALSEIGRHEEARPRIERSLAARRINGYGAHAYTHLCYETADRDAGIAFLRGWLPEYNRAGAMYGHISWHLALFELHAGNVAAGFELYANAISADDHRGAAHQKVTDSVSFLWRSELAGHPRDPARWAKIHDYATKKFTRPGMSLADWHVALACVATGDEAGLNAWLQAIEAMGAAGRYPSGHVVPTVARAFSAYQAARYDEAIEGILSILPERERMGGSRAQVDLAEATLLSACARAGRMADAARIVAQRRPGPSVPPVAGLPPAH